MQIEIDKITPRKNKGGLWGWKECKGMDGGNVNVSLCNGVEIDFNLFDFIFYIANRTEGTGTIGVIEYDEKGN